MQKKSIELGAPWWKFGHVWMVVAGPVVVVLASFVTIYLAIAYPDPVVSVDYYRQGVEINKTLDQKAGAATYAPATQGRNHAATGVLPKAPPSDKP